jgi:hypothetical protein
MYYRQHEMYVSPVTLQTHTRQQRTRRGGEAGGSGAFFRSYTLITPQSSEKFQTHGRARVNL